MAYEILHLLWIPLTNKQTTEEWDLEVINAQRKSLILENYGHYICFYNFMLMNITGVGF